MRVVLSADMEGIAQVRDARDVLASCREYWETGRRRYTDDVAAAARGLLEGGADEVIVLDNHASGNPSNIIGEALPAGAHIEEWNVFDLPRHGVGAMLQVGYHPRAGVPGFLPHSYVPGLHLFVDGQEIGESHGRIWAARTALLGIVGHTALDRTLGALRGVPFLAVQSGEEPHRPAPLFADGRDSAEAIRRFAHGAMRGIAGAPQPAPPADARLEATLGDADDDQAASMLAAGWMRTADATFAMHIADWSDAREPLTAAIAAAMVPFGRALARLDLTSPTARARQDPARLDHITSLFLEATARMAAPWREPAPVSRAAPQ